MIPVDLVFLFVSAGFLNALVAGGANTITSSSDELPEADDQLSFSAYVTREARAG